MNWYDEWFDKYGVNDIGLTHAPESINTRIICRIYNHNCDYCPLKYPCFKKKKGLIPFACLDKYYATITPRIEEKYDVYEDIEVIEKLTNFKGFQWAPESITISLVTWCSIFEDCSKCPLVRMRWYK